MELSLKDAAERWDDFPNGRWGDARSPAFGEIDGYGVTLHVEPSEALRIWGTPTTLQEIGDLFAAYCLGTVDALPWSPDRVLPESIAIAPLLAELNHRHHFFTVGSQPAVNAAPSDDPVVGWGPRRGGYVFQKAFVEFFVAPDRIAALSNRLREAGGKVTFYAADMTGRYFSNSAEDSRNVVTWGVFVGKEIAQPTIVDSLAFMAWKKEAFAIWQEWSLLYPKTSPARKLLQRIRETWWLVNVVYEDFKAPEDALYKLLTG